MKRKALNFDTFAPYMDLATRSLIARTAIALSDKMELVVLPLKVNGTVLANHFQLLEYTADGYKENELIGEAFNQVRKDSAGQGGFDFSKVVGYLNGVVMPLILIESTNVSEDTDLTKSNESDGKESQIEALEPLFESANNETIKKTRKTKK